MIDVADPHACFTVADYREQAFPVIDDILSRGKTPMLVGGTGLYLDAIRYEMKLGENGADENHPITFAENCGRTGRPD